MREALVLFLTTCRTVGVYTSGWHPLLRSLYVSRVDEDDASLLTFSTAVLGVNGGNTLAQRTTKGQVWPNCIWTAGWLQENALEGLGWQRIIPLEWGQGLVIVASSGERFLVCRCTVWLWTPGRLQLERGGVSWKVNHSACYFNCHECFQTCFNTTIWV